MNEPDNRSDQSARFDAVSATHGAAAIALIAFLAISGLLIIFEKFENPDVIGVAMVMIACVHLVSLGWIGMIARPGSHAGRFSFRAGSHGASAFGICTFIACAGVLCIVEEYQRSLLPYGVCLLIMAVTSLSGFLWFGWASDSQNLDSSRRTEDH